ncbi:MAG: DUF2442 domain-containing protein [Lautropia sp.]
MNSSLVWLPGDEERFMPYQHVPWFKKATIEQIADVQLPAPEHLFRPRSNVDLAVASIRDPAAFPLASRAGLEQRAPRGA